MKKLELLLFIFFTAGAEQLLLSGLVLPAWSNVGVRESRNVSSSIILTQSD